MRGPSIGESNLGAAVGAATGAIGGLFAIGFVPALYYRDLSLLIATPTLNLISFCICGVLGWFLGGQAGPRLGALIASPKAELIGGIAGGFIPLVLIAIWGWRMAS